jgi:hypothetical protein
LQTADFLYWLQFNVSSGEKRGVLDLFPNSRKLWIDYQNLRRLLSGLVWIVVIVRLAGGRLSYQWELSPQAIAEL